MADAYEYQKKRSQFGRHPQFEESATKMVCEQEPDPSLRENYILRDPNKINLDNIPSLQVNTVNTERVETKDRGMDHSVGGWPKDMDHTDEQHVQRYTKKLNRDPTLGFASATRDLTRTAERCIKQNNEIDLFEEYFASEKAEHMSEEISTKTLMIFKDPNQIKRAVTKIAWQVEGGTEHRVAVAYAQLRFQQEPPGMPKNSYIWNINDPNRPEVTLEPTSPLCCMQWHHKIQDVLAGGSYNGSVSCFDLRAGSVKGVIKPVQTSVLEKSHHDPVYDVTWATQSRQGNDFFSVSTDGRVLWWDMRSLDAPTDQLILRDANNPEGKIYGGTCLHYNQDAHPHKFLVGSEQGYALNCQNRNKKAECIWRFGDEQGKHHGPIYAMQRNPIHLKYFLTVGDWSAKIWSEELKIPIMQTRYHNSYLTDGCWSQTRAGLFFLTRMDGFLDVWDFFYRQNEVAYSQKISDAVLTSIYVQQSMCAIGDAEGTTSILSLCPALYDQTLQPKEREIMLTIFDREFRREKTLDVAKRLADKKPPKTKEAKNNKAEKLQGQLEQIEENFFGMVAADEEERELIKARGLANQEAINAAADQEALYGGLVEGDTYQFEGQRGSGEATQPTAFAFTVESGGVLNFVGANNTSVSGMIQGNSANVVVQYEGEPISFDGRIENGVIEGEFKEGGVEGPFQVQMVMGGQTNFQK